MRERTRTLVRELQAKPAVAPSRWRLDLGAFGFFAAGLLVAAVLFSYDPERGTNLLGEPGAALATTLVRTLGLASYVLLGSWFVLVILLLVRKSLFLWTRRLAGWLLLVPLAAFLAERWIGVAAPGGVVGAELSRVLGENLTSLNEALVLTIVGLLILILIADDWMHLGVRFVAQSVRWLLALGKEEAKARPTPAVRRMPDLPKPAEASAAVAAPEPRAIPIRHHDLSEIARATTADKFGGSGQGEDFSDFELPSVSLLDEPETIVHADHDKLLRERATLLEKTFTDFGLKVQVVGINTGPVVTQYEIALDVGLRVNKVTRLADDIALNLRVPNVRMVAPIPGKNTVGVEIPNEERARVRLKEVLLVGSGKAAAMRLPIFLGKDAEGRPLVQDLTDMPHLLIAGSTGTGKSVCMNSIILSMLMTRRPDEVKLIMIDPKQGVEMGGYGKVPHLMHPVVEDMKKAEAILAWAVDKMDERYDLLRQARVRNIAAYNQLTPDEVMRRINPPEDERERIPTKMPYIVIIIDELADLMLQYRKEVEGHIIRLAQKSRAAGIHLVLATQKPTVDVITGLIKSNLPARICFKVVNKTDSRVVLDAMGGDKLLGKGDMLFLPPGTSDLVRAQCTFAGDQEIVRVVEELETDEPCFAEELMHLPVNARSGEELHESLRERDDLYDQAVELVLREQRGSVSLLQRALGIGYGRAARLIDFMAEAGVVGGYKGSNAREVLMTAEQWEETRMSGRT